MRSMRRGYFTPPVLIILTIIIFAVAILIAINTDLVKKLKKEPPPTPASAPSSTTQQSTPSPDETANWKTYTNSKYKFSFKYPPNWEIPPDLSEGYPEQNFVVLLKNYNEIDIGITENIESVSEAKKAIYRERAESLNFEFGDIKIGNLVFKEPVFSEGRVPEQEGEWISFIIHKNILYAFSIDTDNPEEDFETFNQILSTFQFID